MAVRLTLLIGGVGLAGYLATIGFAARDEATQKILREKNWTDAPNEDMRKKALFMSVLQNAASGGKPMYRQTKEDIESSLPSK